MMTPQNTFDLLSLFCRIAPPRYWRAHRSVSGFRRRSIFGLAVVVWLMIVQRLMAHGTVAEAVMHLRSGGCRGLLQRCKRVQEQHISAATGAYCQARKKLSKLVVVQIVDELFARLQEVLREGWPGLRRPIFLLDGSTLLLQAEDELGQHYPPSRNQHGASHWPMLRIAVAHDVESGLAVRPAWGPEASSEQKLIEDVLHRLPQAAVVMGDRNFGVFSVAWAALQLGHPVLFRLNHAPARKLLGRPLQAGVDQVVDWRPSAHERHKHPELPANACLSGRLIIAECKGQREPLLCLFTSLEQPANDIVSMYGLRWNIETDLRALKRTVRLHQVHARSVDMMEKELLLAMVAYNLVRTVMCLAARKAGLHPRQLSFTSIYTLIEVHLPKLLYANSPRQWRREMDTLVEYAAAYKLPNRRKPRSYPRAVWGSGYRFAFRKHEEN